MKAIICTKYGAPEVLQLRDVENPIPRDNEVRIRIFATAASASDCIVRSGKVSFWFWIPMRLAIGFTKPRQPILGIPFAGEIDSIGKNTNQIAIMNQGKENHRAKGHPCNSRMGNFKPALTITGKLKGLFLIFYNNVFQSQLSTPF